MTALEKFVSCIFEEAEKAPPNTSIADLMGSMGWVNKQPEPVNANVDLQKETLAQVKEFSEKLDAQHKDHLARRDDEELGFFAAHAMGGMLSRSSFDAENLAEIAFDYAKAMIDYKNKLKKPPKSRLWQCHCKTMNFGITHCGKCGSLRNDK